MTAEIAKNRLLEKKALLVIDRFGMQVPTGISLLPLKISALRLADIRRSVYAFAPKTENLAKQSELLHRLSGGIPALLLPLLKKHTIDKALHLTSNIVPPTIINEFFHKNLGNMHEEIRELKKKRPKSAARGPKGGPKIPKIVDPTAAPLIFGSRNGNISKRATTSDLKYSGLASWTISNS